MDSPAGQYHPDRDAGESAQVLFPPARPGRVSRENDSNDAVVFKGEIMKALSGYAEWFWLIAQGWKDVENRPWPLTRYIKPGELPLRIYLHASKTKASQTEIGFIEAQLAKRNFKKLEEFLAVDWTKYRGAIIGETTITRPYREGDSSPWYFGPNAFWVKDSVLYEAPIPYRGQLGFFPVNLPEHK